jgi:hypothetical protein
MRMLSIMTCASLTVLGAAAPVEGSDAPAPGYTTNRTGDVHDFDYFAGGWTTTQRRLKTRGVGSTEWEKFPATLCMSLYLGGMVTVDELYFPTKGWAGFTVRTFDLERRQWSIYWVSSTTGRMDVVRYTWAKLDHNHARWEQAFSYDDRSWETNWTADFVRADPATTCAAGRPKRT